MDLSNLVIALHLIGEPSKMTLPRWRSCHAVCNREGDIDVMLDHHEGDLSRQLRASLDSFWRSLGERPAHGSSSSNARGLEIEAMPTSSCRRSP